MQQIEISRDDSGSFETIPEHAVVDNPAVAEHGHQLRLALNSNAQQAESHLYLGGRYVKLSRTLSQTPWFIDNNKNRRKTISSVEEIITEPLHRALKPVSISFMSAGREDVDARCLGSGRPFAVDVRGATVPTSAVDLNVVLAEINSSHADAVRVQDLCFVDKEDLRIIKEGEEQKTKTYRALCWSPHAVLQSQLDSLLCKTEPLIVAQTTPVRVLHRRTFSVRNKIIYWMKAVLVANNKISCAVAADGELSNKGCWFYLDMCTQAGMYVKEFVNGDFGRTTPSVMSILNIPEADCEALDVLEVNLAWPPTKHLQTSTA